MELKRRISDRLYEVPKKILSIYVAMFIIYPVIFLFTLSFITGFANLLKIVKIVILLCIPIIPASVAIFYFLNRKLAICIDVILERTAPDPKYDQEKITGFINAFPFRAALSLFGGFVLGTFLALFIAYLQGILFSPEQLLFLLLLGEVPAGIAAFSIFYYAKILLYPSGRMVEFIPLTMFYKFSIPIISSILLLLNAGNISIYKLIFEDVMQAQAQSNRALIDRSGQGIDHILQSSLSEIKSLALMVRTMKLEKNDLITHLQRLHQFRPPDIEMYFAVDEGGYAYAVTKKNIFYGDREYFSKSMNKDTAMISRPLKDKTSGKTAFAVMASLGRESRTPGMVGAFISADVIKKKLHSITEDKALLHVIIGKDGTILYHPRDEYLNINLNDRENREKNHLRDLISIYENKDADSGESTLDNENIVYLKTSLQAMNGTLVMIQTRSVHLAGFNTVILRLSLTLLVISFATFMVLRSITLKLSGPIRNTRKIFQSVASGDLTATPRDILSDEFGDLLRYLSILLRKLNDVMTASMDSSLQVKDSSTQLSKTSQKLSSSAHDQSASIEEMSASLEETAGAIEAIAGNARDQSTLATASHKSMENLKEIIYQVNHHAEEALKRAVISTEEAMRGNELMQNTIKGMDSISASTNKISEFISQISDISDQVNLLALNAAIEAARAGEHGRGFAVVADEITKLADQTSESAGRITELVHSGNAEVNRGREYVDATSIALTNIIHNIRDTDILVRKIVEFARTQSESSDTVLTETKKVMEMAGNIYISTDEQMTANREMIKAISEINAMTMEVENGSSYVAGSSQEINSRAEVLYNHIKFFKVKKE